MRLITIFILLFTAILHAASAFPSQGEDLDFFEASKLPDCTRNCKALLSAISRCSLIPIQSSKGTPAPYLYCFCGQEELRSESFAHNMCIKSCSTEDKAVVERFYMGVCRYEEMFLSSTRSTSTSVPMSTPMLLPSLTATLTHSTTPTSTTLTGENLPVPTVASVAGKPREERESTESW